MCVPECGGGHVCNVCVPVALWSVFTGPSTTALSEGLECMQERHGPARREGKGDACKGCPGCRRKKEKGRCAISQSERGRRRRRGRKRKAAYLGTTTCHMVRRALSRINCVVSLSVELNVLRQCIFARASAGVGLRVKYWYSVV